jgi:hypothetical protein
MPRRQPARFSLTRLFVWAVVVTVGLISLTLAFLPASALEGPVVRRLEAATGARVSLAQIQLGFGGLLPFGELHDVELRWSDGTQIDVARLRATPVPSLAWLRGVPDVHVTLDSSAGGFEGRLSAERVKGQTKGFDLSKLPRRWLGESGAPVEGPVDAQLDLTRHADQWSGSVSFAGRKGVLALAGAPVSLPYETLAGALDVDEIGALRLSHFALTGPLATGNASGTVQPGYAGPATGAVDLTVDVQRVDPAFVPTLIQAGIPLDPAGTGRLRVTGTPDRPTIR